MDFVSQPPPAATPPTNPMPPGMEAPAQPPVPSGEDPGQTLAIVGLIAGCVLTPLVGLILCLIAKKQSKAAGFHNTLAIVGVWIFGVIVAIAVFAIIMVLAFLLLALKG